MKNKILFSVFLISQIPSLFFGTTDRMNLSLITIRSTRLDFVALYYANAISFLIMAYCLHYKRGIDNRITKFILIVTSLDFIHLLLFAKQGFGTSKIGLTLLIYMFAEWRTISLYIKNTLSKWQT
jgi:hypothetical protein